MNTNTKQHKTTTGTETNPKKGGTYHSLSLCWGCARSMPGSKNSCPWATRFEPIPNWTAEPTILRSAVPGYPDTNSFHISSCPLYVPDLAAKIETMPDSRLSAYLGTTAHFIRCHKKVAKQLVYELIKALIAKKKQKIKVSSPRGAQALSDASMTPEEYTKARIEVLLTHWEDIRDDYAFAIEDNERKIEALKAEEERRKKEGLDPSVKRYNMLTRSKKNANKDAKGKTQEDLDAESIARLLAQPMPEVELRAMQKEIEACEEALLIVLRYKITKKRLQTKTKEELIYDRVDEILNDPEKLTEITEQGKNDKHGQVLRAKAKAGEVLYPKKARKAKVPAERG